MKYTDIFQLLKDRNCSTLWASSMISNIGTGVSSFAMMWWILETTGSSLKMGTVALVMAITNALAGPILGAFVDKHRKHRDIFIYADIASALILLVMASLMLKGFYSLPIYYLLVSLQTAAAIPKTGCASALMQRIVPNALFEKSIALWSLTNNGALMLGPAIGGVIVASYGAAYALIFDALSFIVSGAMKFLMSVKEGIEHEGETSRGIFRMIGQGLKYLLEQKAILGMLSVATTSNLVCGAISVVMLVFVKEDLQQSAAFYGRIESVFVLGMVSLALFLSFVTLPQRGRKFLIMALFFIWSSAIYFIGSTKMIAVCYLSMWLFGAAESVWSVIFESFVLRNVSPSQMGRFYATFSLIQKGFQPVTIFAYSLLMENISAASMLIFMGSALFSIGLATPFIKSISVGASTSTATDAQVT